LNMAICLMENQNNPMCEIKRTMGPGRKVAKKKNMAGTAIHLDGGETSTETGKKLLERKRNYRRKRGSIEGDGEGNGTGPNVPSLLLGPLEEKREEGKDENRPFKVFRSANRGYCAYAEVVSEWMAHKKREIILPQKGRKGKTLNILK